MSNEMNQASQPVPQRPVRDRAELVMEIAMRTRFRERKRKKVERPTIDQLEAILNEVNPPAVDILADGSVMTIEEQPVFISDLLECALTALYEDGFEIVESGVPGTVEEERKEFSAWYEANYRAIAATSSWVERAWATWLAGRAALRESLGTVEEKRK